MSEIETSAKFTPTGSDEQPSAFPVDYPTRPSVDAASSRLPLKMFHDVQVHVSVELGRTRMTIHELLQLGEGSVIELDRNVSEAVDIIAQGVRIARGEVCIVEDHYAVRLTEIESESNTSVLDS
ncbi:flagellar motor switch protein FliN [Thalassoglobus sp. JC818]|uniref:flagellar motor switch protein FliN n=1 Tax=Thalassoglobus sp. JC818 TaxID=3232136 RepID=UPI003458E6BC